MNLCFVTLSFFLFCHFLLQALLAEVVPPGPLLAQALVAVPGEGAADLVVPAADNVGARVHALAAQANLAVRALPVVSAPACEDEISFFPTVTSLAKSIFLNPHFIGLPGCSAFCLHRSFRTPL